MVELDLRTALVCVVVATAACQEDGRAPVLSTTTSNSPGGSAGHDGDSPPSFGATATALSHEKMYVVSDVPGPGCTSAGPKVITAADNLNSFYAGFNCEDETLLKGLGIA